jgi:hypothetical protein
MSGTELRKVAIWFQVAFPIFLVEDALEENFWLTIAPRGWFKKLKRLSKAASGFFGIDLYDRLLKMFAPDDIILLLECRQAIKDKFGLVRGRR